MALRGIATTPSTPTLYLNAVGAQIGQGNLAAAARTVGLFAQRAPRNPFAFMLRAGLFSAQREFDSAEVAGRALAQLAPDVGWQGLAAYILSQVSLVRGKLAEGESHTRAGMSLAERRGQPGTYVGAAAGLAIIDLRYRNAPEAARRRVEEALRRHPLASINAADRPYTMLAWYYAEAGHPDRGRQLLAEYELAVPEGLRRRDAFRHGAAAAVAFAEGRVQDAITGYRAWYDEAGCAVCGLFELGRAYERAGQRDSALAAYERAVTTPGFLRALEETASLGPTYRRLGELYEERGQLDKARDYYGRFVDLWKYADPELQPHVRDVKQRLARLSAEGAR